MAPATDPETDRTVERIAAAAPELTPAIRARLALLLKPARSVAR
ncbi:hypothetical protein [Mycetocola sp.]